MHEGNSLLDFILDDEEDEVAEKLRENSHWVISKDRK
jgi:hypothetical protein